MTATARDEEPLDPWFADRHRSLCHGLSQFLEPDAGLREATFHTRHVSLLADLGSHLHPGRACCRRGPARIASRAAPAHRGRGHRCRRSRRTPALRRHPVILTVIPQRLTAWALTVASEIPIEWNPYGDLDRARTVIQDFGMAYTFDLDRLLDFDRDLTRDRHRGLADARELAQDLDFGSSRAARGRAVALVHELTRANVLATDLAAAAAAGSTTTAALRPISH